MRGDALILGAGITGLSAGWASGLLIYEAENTPGGICSSYYMRPGETKRLSWLPEDGEAYRFEIGGGHWIFGSDPLILRFIRSLTTVKLYERKSAVFFPTQKLLVPYPIQHHLGYLGKEVATRALTEMLTGRKENPRTMAEWIESTFGPTLTEIFFGPFHELYTAGLWRYIAPQDSYKSPVSIHLAIQGAFDRTPPVGYNATFLYPEAGLGTLIQRIAKKCRIQYGKRALQIDVRRKKVFFSDGSDSHYQVLISTLPLNKVVEMAGLEIDEPPDPYTSVLVLNIGAERGPECPKEHWVYVPESRAGFHRVGFYSNVDVSFLPKSAQATQSKISIYVERSFRGGESPNEADIENYKHLVIEELKSWGWIGEVEVADSTWIEVAYTWSWPGSNWRQKALKLLEEHGIYQVGRYGRWVFQGIMDSMREGLLAGGILR